MTALSVALKQQAAPASVARPTQSFWSTALAAAVMLALTGGLVLMVYPSGPRKTDNKKPLAGPTADPKKDDAPPAPPAELTVAEQTKIKTLIAALDAEDFKTRQNAAKELAEFGLRILPFLKDYAAHLEKKSDKRAELRHGLAKVVQAIDDTEKARVKAIAEARIALELKEALAGVESAVKEAPKHYLPPDPATLERLKKKVSFEFVDKPAMEAVAFLGDYCGVAIGLDPSVKLEDMPAITLRVGQMETGVALSWSLRLVELDSVTRARAVIITTEERAARLRLQERIFVLPLLPNDAQWTQVETDELARLLRDWPVLAVEGADGMQHRKAELPVCRAPEPGKLLIHAQGHFEDIEAFLKSFATGKLPEPALPGWTTDLDESLKKKVSLDLKNGAIVDVVTRLKEDAGISIILDPKLVAAGLPEPEAWSMKDVVARDCVVRLCQKLKCSANLSNGAVFLSRQTALGSAPQVLDLRPALKAGVDSRDLQSQLAVLLDEAGQRTAGVIRGRWFAVTDDWTAVRAHAVIDGAAKTGKVPPLPPAPWFFATFKNVKNEPPAQP